MTLFLPTTVSTLPYGSAAPNRNTFEGWTPFSADAMLSDASGIETISFTPRVGCYFAVDLRVLIDSGAISGNTSNYLETFLICSPGDADGRIQCVANLPLGLRAHSLSTYISGLFRLSAGVGYTFSARLAGFVGANVVRYYGGSTYCELTGHVVGY